MRWNGINHLPEKRAFETDMNYEVERDNARAYNTDEVNDGEIDNLIISLLIMR
jgi:hypothetical protein